MPRFWIRTGPDGLFERKGSADGVDLSAEGWQEADADTWAAIGATIDKRKASDEARADFAAGAPAAALPRKQLDPGDAKRDGLSNPSARPAQDWNDGPRNANPMPRAGSKPKPTIQAGRVETGDPTGFVARQAEGARKPAGGPGLERVEKVSPQVAAYMLQRMEGGGDALSDARARAERGTLFARLGRAGAMINEGVTGARFDRAAYDDLEDGAQQPVRDVLARREMGREDEQDRLRTEDTRRRWAASDRDFEYRKTRDGAEDDLARERIAADERRARGDNAYRWAALREQREGRAAMERARAEERAAAAQAKEGAMKERQDEKDMAELGKRTDKLAQTKADVETTNRFLATPEGDDIPGAGMWDSVKMENSLLRGLFASEDDVESWQSSQRMAASYLNQMTGQSFTPLEATRTLQRYGVRPGATEQEWRTGMTAFIRDVKAGLIQKEAPFSHVVPEFRRRGGVTAQDIPAPAGQPAVMQDPSGRRFTVDADEVEEATRNGWRLVNG